MPTANGDTLLYAPADMPATTRAAWGARLIVTQDGYVDFLHDRQSFAGEDRGSFLQELDEQYPLNTLLDDVRQLLRSNELDTRRGRDVTLYDGATLEVHADTRGSAGYCYVWAFSKEAS